MSQRPSVGRIVHALVDPTRNNGSDVAPAVITRVFNDELVNVRILFDAHDIEWKTSVLLLPTKEALEARQPAIDGKPFGAFWPPMVGR